MCLLLVRKQINKVIHKSQCVVLIDLERTVWQSRTQHALELFLFFFSLHMHTKTENISSLVLSNAHLSHLGSAQENSDKGGVMMVK